MLCNLRGDEHLVEGLQLGEGTLLVSPDETAVTSHVCSKDRREPALDTLPIHAQSSSGGTCWSLPQNLRFPRTDPACLATFGPIRRLTEPHPTCVLVCRNTERSASVQVSPTPMVARSR